MAIRVLIIDPDIPFLVRIKQALDDTNRFNVSISANGLAAEDALHHHRHDIAVLDFSVPDMDTVAIITQLRHIQPNLAVIVTPESSAQSAYSEDLSVQGMLPKPYTARDLIALVQQIIPTDPRAAEYEDESENELDVFTPPEMPPGLRHLLVPAPPTPTELLDHVERAQLPGVDAAPPSALDRLRAAGDAPDAWDAASSQDWDNAAMPGTHLLDQNEPDPNTTEILTTGDELDPTMRLAETETLDDLILQHDWLTPPDRSGAGLNLEPPVDPEDTPTVPNQDLDSIRQFLATDQQGHISAEFGEVLDAVSQTPINEPNQSTSDREFHDLVESLRMTEEQNAALTPLDALLTSMAAEQAARSHGDEPDATSNTLDYVLNAIHRSEEADDPDRQGGSSRGSETIGEVMNGLFDPAFEGVLAALAGKDIDEANEPGGSIAEPATGDISLDDLRAQAQAASLDGLSGADDPAWLANYSPGGILPDEAAPRAPFGSQGEPADDDSATYPATQVLNVVSGSDSSEFSLDALLSEIERHIPQSPTPRPRLKPLPSWNQARTDQENAPSWASFESLDAGESVPPPSDEMLRYAPGFSQDTQPSRSVMDEWEDRAWETPAPSGTEGIAPPAEIAPPEEVDEAPAFEIPGRTADAAAFEAPAFETPAFETPTFETFDAPEPSPADDEDAAFEAFFAVEPEPLAEVEPPQSAQEPDEDLAEIFEGLLEEAAAAIQFAAPVDAIPATEADLGDIERPAFDAPGDQSEWAWDGDEAPLADEAARTPQETGEPAPYRAGDAPESMEAAREAMALSPAAPDEVYFAPAAPGSDADEDTRLAHAAVEMTRFALENSAQAVLLTRAGQRLAEAGDLPVVAMDRLYDTVTSLWQTSSATPSLMRYIRLPDMGDFMLYSTVVEDDLILSMIFHAGMSIHATRQLAQRISTSLASVPDAAPARPAAIPSPQPGLDQAPPSADDLREAAEQALEQAAAGQALAHHPPAETAEIRAAAQPDEPATAYTCFWLIADPGRFTLGGDLAEDLHNWIGEVAQENGWEVPALEVGPDSVVLTLSIPQKTLPDAAVTVFMQETANAAAAYYPEVMDETGRLWADGYYLITPPRALTDREMARFAAYQYQQ